MTGVASCEEMKPCRQNSPGHSDTLQHPFEFISQGFDFIRFLDKSSQSFAGKAPGGLLLS
jgi:hypothetical protein